MCLKLKNNSIFIADSHFNDKNLILLDFLKKIESGEIKTTQLILMGDMFDFLTSLSKYFITKNQIVIDLLNKLSNNLEIIYFEGNHDYNIKSLFPKIRVYSRDEQPIKASYNNKSILLSHGDIYVDKLYDVYCSFIRNKIFLKTIDFLDYKNKISKKIYASLLNKSICHKIPDFKALINKKIANYEADYIIEGHYHQGDFINFEKKVYINIPSLLCSNEYVVLNNDFQKIKLENKCL